MNVWWTKNGRKMLSSRQLRLLLISLWLLGLIMWALFGLGIGKLLY